MRKFFFLASTLTLLFWSGIAGAGSIEPTRANLFPTDEGYALSADFAIDLGSRVEDAVTHGVPLYFNLELEVTRPRRYWIDEHVLSHSLTYKLSYNALTRHFRLGTGGLQRSFDTLPEALRAMGRISALPITEKSTLKSGESYEAKLRLALDRSQLPKPFQLDAITTRDWQVDSKSLQWQVIPAGDSK